jgi:hypothetical protein
MNFLYRTLGIRRGGFLPSPLMPLLDEAAPRQAILPVSFSLINLL